MLVGSGRFCYWVRTVSATFRVSNRVIGEFRVVKAPRGVGIEAAGFEVLGGLLEIFVSALNDAARKGTGASTRSKKLLQLLPAESLGPGRAPDADPYTRLLKMTDFVSGMTDSYAVSLYRKVRGISLPGAR